MPEYDLATLSNTLFLAVPANNLMSEIVMATADFQGLMYSFLRRNVKLAWTIQADKEKIKQATIQLAKNFHNLKNKLRFN